MPIIILAVAVMLIVTAYNDTYGALFSQLSSDMPGFLVWGGLILLLWLGGEATGMEKPAKALLLLVFLAFILQNQSALGNLSAAFSGSTPPVLPQPVQQAPLPAGIPIESAGGSTGDGGIGGALGTAASFPLGGLMGGIL